MCIFRSETVATLLSKNFECLHALPLNSTRTIARLSVFNSIPLIKISQLNDQNLIRCYIIRNKFLGILHGE